MTEARFPGTANEERVQGKETLTKEDKGVEDVRAMEAQGHP